MGTWTNVTELQRLLAERHPEVAVGERSRTIDVVVGMLIEEDSLSDRSRRALLRAAVMADGPVQPISVDGGQGVTARLSGLRRASSKRRGPTPTVSTKIRSETLRRCS